MANNNGELRKVQTGRAGSVDKNGVARRATMTTVTKRVGGDTTGVDAAGMRGSLSKMADSGPRKAEAWERLHRAQLNAGPPGSEDRSPRASREVADASVGFVRALADETSSRVHGAPMSDLVAQANVMSEHYTTALKELENAGEKPDRTMKKLGRQLKRLKNNVDAAYDDVERDADRRSLEDAFRGVAKTAGKVKESDDPPAPVLQRPTTPEPTYHDTRVDHDDAVAILGRAYDSEMTKYEMDRYRQAGEKPPAELAERYYRVTRNPYEDF